MSFLKEYRFETGNLKTIRIQYTLYSTRHDLTIHRPSCRTAVSSKKANAFIVTVVLAI